MKRLSGKRIALLLIVTMLVSSMPISVLASDRAKIINNGNYTAEKISNPTQGEGKADGLENPGDRLNSYAWCMEQLGDYIYIGSNRNILYTGVKQYINQMPELQDKAGLVDKLIDVITNGEIPTDATGMRAAVIVRYNMKTGKLETYFDAAHYTDPCYSVFGFRMAKCFKGAIYMNAMAASGNVVYKIDENSEPGVDPEVVNIGGGANLRAMTLSQDNKALFIGGTEANNDNTYAFKPVVYKSTDGITFEKIADYNTPVFAKYIDKNAGYYAGSGGDVWDMVEYKGKLYVTFLTLKGSPVFVGNKMPNGSYVWKEFAGDNTVNIVKNHYGIGFGNPENYAMTPYVFNNDLYFITFSNVMDCLVTSAQGLMAFLTSEDQDINEFFDSLEDIENVMTNQASVFRYTDGGQMQMVVGNKDRCPRGIEFVAKIGAGFNNDTHGTTGYNWRAAVYNDKLYVGTLDTYSIYKYVTKLTNGDLLNMNDEEFRQQLEYVITLLEELLKTPAKPTETSDNTIESLEQTLNQELLENVEEKEIDEAEIEKIIDALVKIQQSLDKEATVKLIHNALKSIPEAEKALGKIGKVLECMINEYKDSPKMLERLEKLYTTVTIVQAALAKVDEEGLNRYVRISETIAANKNPGFELYCTEDGVNYDMVTVNGFNDKYNYGVRTLLATESGLFLGTANPFYGAQLWKITETVSPAPTPDPTPVITDKDRFEAYQSEQIAECDKLLKPDDSDAVKALVEEAKKAINNVEYDGNKTLDQNKEVIDAIVAELKLKMETLRADEATTAMVKASKVSLTKASALKNGKIQLSFKRLALKDGTKVVTYQVYRSTKKKSGFKKVPTVNNHKSSKTITYTNTKKLKKGKKYYYKVRGAVKLSDGSYVYTKWSGTKWAKCRKSR